MNADALLTQFTIPTPCAADWELMTGDDRSRFCGSCGKHVYNLAGMPADEAIVLITAHDGTLCGRLYQRPDGTLSTTACPQTVAPPLQSWQFRIRSIMAVIAGFAAALGFVRELLEPAIPPSSGSGLLPPGHRTLIVGAMRPRGPVAPIKPAGGQPCQVSDETESPIGSNSND